ncbi:MAG: enoyl-CoA hydratase/isomerase family protein [Acidimicrobiales bacterium]
MGDIELVRVERREGGVGMLVLNRPERLNAISTATAAVLSEGVADLAADDRVGAIVVAGEGRSFCAGADVSELETLDGPPEFSAFVHRLTDAFGALASCPKPSVAARHGSVLGGGLELALACDLRVADETARLGVPEVKLGLLPGASGTARLPRLVPRSVAKQLLMTGEALSADDAHRLGLVNEVVAGGMALDAALALATTLAGLPPLALAAAKRLVDEGAALPMDAAITLERETVSMLFGTDDRQEGLRAFREKRPPSFKGT